MRPAASIARSSLSFATFAAFASFAVALLALTFAFLDFRLRALECSVSGLAAVEAFFAAPLVVAAAVAGVVSCRSFMSQGSQRRHSAHPALHGVHPDFDLAVLVVPNIVAPRLCFGAVVEVDGHDTLEPFVAFCVLFAVSDLVIQLLQESVVIILAISLVVGLAHVLQEILWNHSQQNCHPGILSHHV